VITITAYTEPIPPPSPQINETPIVNESEENEEQSEFAEILAGYLRKNETQLDFAPVSLDSEGIDALAEISGAELLQSGFLAGIEETGDIPENALSGIEIPQDETFPAELSGEYREVLLSAEHLFTRLEPQVPDDISGAASEKSVNKPESLFAVKETPKDLSSFTANEVNIAAETYVSAETAEEASLSRTESKKERVSFKDEKIPSGEKDKKTEDLFFVNKKNDAPGRLEEMRNRSRRDKVTFDVRDFRTGTGVNESTGTRPYSAVETTTGRPGSEAPVREITMELRLPDNAPAAQSSSQTTWEAKASSALENMLARELHQNFNGDIVRHASMALRDGGEGTIKIALKPESLGNVKISLEMTENKITGHIVVESEEALSAFRKEISSLEQAFRDSGFSNADLNLSLTSEGQGAWQEQEESSFTQAMVSSRYESSYEQDALPIDVFFSRSGSVNLFA
jgi:hypothetical protein